MFAWKTLWLLLVHSFSADSASLRYPTRKRIVAVVLMWVFFAVHLPFTWLCLWLDRLIYPGFQKVDVSRSVFIVGLPRSGTTFLLNSLGEDTKTFTGFRLWELVFAPSVLQKKAWLGLRRLDRMTGHYGLRIVSHLEQQWFGRMEGVHTLRFAALEEDEFLFTYLFRSIYLTYLFPELHAQHRLLDVDGEGREVAMQFYKACVQRHLYVFDPVGKKTFLSKNPGYLTRLDALMEAFPDSRFIHLARPLEEVAPSMLSLNRRLLSFFVDVESRRTLRIETLQMLVKWQQYLEEKGNNERWLRVSFGSLTSEPSSELDRLYEFARLKVPIEVGQKWKEIDQVTGGTRVRTSILSCRKRRGGSLKTGQHLSLHWNVFLAPEPGSSMTNEEHYDLPGRQYRSIIRPRFS